LRIGRVAFGDVTADGQRKLNMKLLEALEILHAPVEPTAPRTRVALAAGYTPLHLRTFLAAHLRVLLPAAGIDITTGRFGDLTGNIEGLRPGSADWIVIPIEWSDLDPRLGLRRLGGWRFEQLPEILASARQMASRIEHAITQRSIPAAVVSLPTLPLPPMFVTRLAQRSSARIELDRILCDLAEALSVLPGVRIVEPDLLASCSPATARYDLKSDVTTGFPYTVEYANTLAETIACLIANRAPMKGLVTDLDDTLWAGIVGEDGVDRISWDLDHHSHLHGIYQQFLSSLASSGVLIGVASKNDPNLAAQALDRSDLLLSKRDIYPIEASWSRKSESLRRILEVWNIHPESVVFIDDSPMEIAEVRSAFPTMDCRVFPKNDPQAFWQMLHDLRDAFGKTSVSTEDSIRLQSIRATDAHRKESLATGVSAEDFLKDAEAFLTFDASGARDSARSFELVNKTNQFNLNGKRFTEAEWRKLISDPDVLVIGASYRDKYGPLGTVGVMLLQKTDERWRMLQWVMSCRAFSRRIEHQSLNYLFGTMEVDEVVFDYERTPRNGPMQEFLAEITAGTGEEGKALTKDEFFVRVPKLFHRVEAATHV
jgi:FkbH-like protein